MFLGQQGIEHQQAGAGHDGAVGHVEVRPVIGEDVDLDEVDDRAVGDAVVDVADGAAQYQGQGDGGERDAAPRRIMAMRTAIAAIEVKAISAQRTVCGLALSAKRENAAPSLSQWVMRRTRGMTGIAPPIGNMRRDPRLGDAIGDEDGRGDEKQPGQTPRGGKLTRRPPEAGLGASFAAARCASRATRTGSGYRRFARCRRGRLRA